VHFHDVTLERTSSSGLGGTPRTERTINEDSSRRKLVPQQRLILGRKARDVLNIIANHHPGVFPNRKETWDCLAKALRGLVKPPNLWAHEWPILVSKISSHPAFIACWPRVVHSSGPGSISSILLDCVRSLVMQYGDWEKEETILWARDHLPLSVYG
jgi:hypothetical protein